MSEAMTAAMAVSASVKPAAISNPDQCSLLRGRRVSKVGLAMDSAAARSVPVPSPNRAGEPARVFALAGDATAKRHWCDVLVDDVRSAPIDSCPEQHAQGFGMRQIFEHRSGGDGL